MTLPQETILRNEILNCTGVNFEEIALKVFNFQYSHNDMYRSYCNLLRINPSQITSIEKIPKKRRLQSLELPIQKRIRVSHKQIH